MLNRLFEPSQLLRGMRLVALGGVALCLVSLFLSWTPGRATSRHSGPVPTTQGPPGLQVVDAPRPADDVVYGMLAETNDAGWDKPLAEAMELLLLAVLVLLALRPEVPRPDWLRFAPIATAVTCLVWMLACGAVLPGPLLFLAGLVAVGVAGVQQAFARAEWQEEPQEEWQEEWQEEPQEEWQEEEEEHRD